MPRALPGYVQRVAHIRALLSIDRLTGIVSSLFHVDWWGDMRVPGSYLSEVNQSVDIAVDRSGPNPFHVKLDRPFLFLIRDNTTNVLLFIGAVTDPNQT